MNGRSFDKLRMNENIENEKALQATPASSTGRERVDSRGRPPPFPHPVRLPFSKRRKQSQVTFVYCSIRNYLKRQMN